MLHPLVCKNIRHYRRVQGFTQQMLAEKSGLDIKTVCNIETNRIKTEPYPGTLTKIAKTLGMKAEDLYKPIHFLH